MNDPELRFSVLGPVRAWRDGAEVDVGSPQQRLVLAVLAVAGGRVVAQDQLLDAIWGEARPRSAIGTLRTYVSRLRSALGPEAISSVGSGYALTAGACDLAVLDELAREGRHGEALALWQGEPLTGLDGGYAHAQRARLAERRLTLLERRLGEDVEQGRHAEVVAELTSLCAEHPVRERLAGLLMLALYRSGRQAEAIGVFTDLRKLLAEELGVDPSPELAELYRRIISADPALGAEPEGTGKAATPVPRQLPADMTDFTGREPDVEQVTRALQEGNGSALVISAVAGAGGMGKTTLAVHVAHRLAAAYPDGQLFVDLQGAGPRPLTPEAVLGGFLRALGADMAALPEELDERAALYRSLLAERRVLVLLDNAASAGQVRPLLPGTAGCAVLVTSRARLSALSGARHLGLEAMRPEEALELLAKVVGQERVAAEREAAQELMRACGYLPLAIRIVASRLAARPGWSLARLLGRMADERRRLAELRVDDLAVEATFALGYDQLDEAHAAAFRLLAVPNAADLPAPAAAAVLGVTEAEAEELCEALVNVHLMESPAPGRYRHHDLLKLYARSRLDGEEPRRQALDRLLGHYLAAMAWLVDVMYPGDPVLDHVTTSAPRPSFADLHAAIAWGQAEEEGMLGCLHQIADTPGTALHDAVSLLDMMTLVFDFESSPSGYERVVERLVAAAAERGEWTAEAHARRKRGEILYARRDTEAAEAEARAVRDRADARPADHACAVNVLAMLAHDRRAYDEAIAMYNETLGTWRTLGHRSEEAILMGNLALVLAEAGRGEEGVEVGERAVAITRELGGGRPNPQILYQLAVALGAAGRHQEALTRFGAGRAEFQRLRQHAWEGLTLRRMAETYLLMGRPDRAVDHAEESLVMLHETDQGWMRGKALAVLGRALHGLGRRSRATACLTGALAIMERQGSPDADDVRTLLATLDPPA
ncbi:tetratricopeptide repeat protein [Nonomuraea sp. PA05]|uniref:AfsR/SARP family transcriptional regulator n=1 Tax=Nonomuraea sp. PA05 TaxID=2604466 RepID=UPI0011D49AB3|nr:BTAD domain-containing putative transcriptional regulator [Nonomuraea sp. PA05]TYB69104.1 tetratricopeptide repeat protein [Nonomuraea sp. PA05]